MNVVPLDILLHQVRSYSDALLERQPRPADVTEPAGSLQLQVGNFHMGMKRLEGVQDAYIVLSLIDSRSIMRYNSIIKSGSTMCGSFEKTQLIKILSTLYRSTLYSRKNVVTEIWVLKTEQFFESFSPIYLLISY